MFQWHPILTTSSLSKVQENVHFRYVLPSAGLEERFHSILMQESCSPVYLKELEPLVHVFFCCPFIQCNAGLNYTSIKKLSREFKISLYLLLVDK